MAEEAIAVADRDDIVVENTGFDGGRVLTGKEDSLRGKPVQPGHRLIQIRKKIDKE